MTGSLVLAWPSASTLEVAIDPEPQLAPPSVGPSGTPPTATVAVAVGQFTIRVGRGSGTGIRDAAERRLIAGYAEEARYLQTPEGQAEDAQARARARRDRERALRLV